MTSNKFKTSARGFTLVETLIAVLLLMVAISGPLTLAEKGLHITLVAKDQDNAFYLAQDAIEYVRWVRDTNKLSGGNWLTGAGGAGTAIDLTHCTSGDGSASCYFDSFTTSGAPTSCGSGCPVLNYDSSLNKYTNAATGGSITPSIFTRTVSIKTPICDDATGLICNNSEASVKVTVTWRDQGSLVRTVTVREDIFDWQ